MKKHEIKNISNTRIEFATKSKRSILDIFNHRCKSKYMINESDLQLINDKMCLVIELSKWKDIDDETDFINVLEALKRITDPKGGNPVMILDARLTGHDNDKELDFIFTGKFVDGKQVVAGEYANGQKMIYTEDLYIE